MGVNEGDPNVSAEEILKQANGMQKQLLDLRLDSGTSSTGNDEQAVLKKFVCFIIVQDLVQLILIHDDRSTIVLLLITEN